MIKVILNKTVPDSIRRICSTYRFIATLCCRGSQKAFAAKCQRNSQGINDVLNKNKNKPNEPVAKVLQKDI